MTSIFGDGYEASTEPGPDVEWRHQESTLWTPLGKLVNCFSPPNLFRRPIKLRAGETYRMRDGRMVDDLTFTTGGKLYTEMYPFWSKKYKMTWTSNGKRCLSDSEILKYTDLVEHIEKQPKGNSMESVLQNIKVPGPAIGCHYSNGTSDYYITIDQAISLGEHAKAMKAEAEIKAGDFVMTHKHRLGRAVKCNEGFIEVSGFVSGIAAMACQKVRGTPDQIAWLKSVFDGAK